MSLINRPHGRFFKNFLVSLLETSIEAEDKIWLDADLGSLPPYEWGPEGVPEGKPVYYKPGTGLIVKGG